MFEHLKEWQRILVTGPQRSGTTIAAKMIAHDTGHHLHLEEDIHVDSLNFLCRRLRISQGQSKPIVVQCPAMSMYANHFGVHDDRLAVVMMIRPLAEIAASIERIQWDWEEPEYIRLQTYGGPPSSAELKYGLWEAYQRECLADQAFEVGYKSLADHPLWIPAEQRKDFTSRQTE